jgi:hypothetical protein
MAVIRPHGSRRIVKGMQRIVLAVVLVVGSVGCRKAGIAIGSAVTVTSATSGAVLIATSDREGDRRETGVLLVSSAILAMSFTAVMIAAGSLPSTATTSGESAPSWAASSDSTSSSTTAPSSTPSTSYRFDRSGALDGHRDPNGYYYDKTGASDGHVDSNGYYYDKTGASAGHVDSNGYYYDKTGASAGRVDSSGNFYDKTGASAGHIDSNGYVYDATGAQAGRVDANCDEACRRETIGRILIQR